MSSRELNVQPRPVRVQWTDMTIT